ncbi:MAG: hypothetical protein ACFFC7_33755 [Candidatus Hermodarchaeota archaeon]
MLAAGSILLWRAEKGRISDLKMLEKGIPKETFALFIIYGVINLFGVVLTSFFYFFLPGGITRTDII